MQLQVFYIVLEFSISQNALTNILSLGSVCQCLIALSLQCNSLANLLETYSDLFLLPIPISYQVDEMLILFP